MQQPIKFCYVQGHIVSGTIPNVTTYSYKPGASAITIKSGSYIDKDITIEGDANLAAGNIKAGTSIFGVLGTFTNDGTAAANQMLSGAKAYVKGNLVTGNIQNQGATTISPSKNAQTITKGKYIDQDITIKGDNNLVAGNIKQGVSIFGVTGTFTNDGTAAANQILSGAKAYVKGNLITGNIPNQNATTITPGKSSQTINSGKYLNQNITISGDNNLVAGNIKCGVSIFKTQGNYKCLSGLAAKAKVGQYVRMTPTASSFTVPGVLTGRSRDQTIKPNELTLWRILFINDDGTMDLISEYTSSSFFELFGKTGYKNAIGVLNMVASAYGNSSYTVSSRNPGYNGQTPFIQNELSVSNVGEAQGMGDQMYTKDYNQITSVFGRRYAYRVDSPTNAGTYWMSRRYYDGANNFVMYNPGISWSGSSDMNYGVNMWNGADNETGASCYLRPIVTLKAGVNASSGDGTTADKAWVLS